MVKRLHVRVALPQVAQLFFGRYRQTVRQEPQRIAVPAGDIQIGAYSEMVEFGDIAHVVMGNRAGRVTPDDPGLQAVECHNLI